MFKEEFNNKRIFVTGGTGSIGWWIVQALLLHKPKEIVVYSRDEQKQTIYMRAMAPGTPIRFVIGDVRDRDRLQSVMRGSDIVFHAAALKHVNLCEKNPYETIQTNAIGTQHVIDAAISNQAEKVIVISTDKAADASNVLGITKRLAEKIALLGNQEPDSKTKISCVRFGNVLGSKGSVVPLFMEQIRNHNKITLTDPAMTRFCMSIPQAVQLILKSVMIMRGGEIFILKMPVVRVGDLAQAIITLMQGMEERSNGQVEISIVGKRPGERIHEKLLTEDESRCSLETDDMFIVLESTEASHKNMSLYANASQPTINTYESDKLESLSIEAVIKLVKPIIYELAQ